MNSTLFLRVSGLALLVGGISLALSELLMPKGDQLSITLSSQWFLILILGIVTNIAITLGIIGLYLIQSETIGILGLAASLIAFVAVALSIALATIEGFVYPAFARLANPPSSISALIGPDGPLALVGQLDNLFAILFLVGFIALGVMMTWSRALGRWPSGLLLISTILDIGHVINAPQIALVGDLLFGIALAWLGWLVWRMAPTQVGTSAHNPQGRDILRPYQPIK